MNEYLFTSESVSEGHPDKVADQISDAILDAAISQDKYARVAAETLVSKDLVVLSGEITAKANIDYEQIVRQTVRQIGYNNAELGFDYQTCQIIPYYGNQSTDIAQGVNEGEGIDKTQGAGDQGIMFGYACDETSTLMPFPIYYAHRLMQRQSELRRDGRLPWLRPDAKSQITCVYDKNTGQPIRIDTVVLSTQHDPGISYNQLYEAVMEEIIRPVLPVSMLTKQSKYFINPTGRFVTGGPNGDCGLTGRKIIVDTYGAAAPHGGGAFSGKDPSKMDRSAAYAGRYVAKNIVAAKLAKQCQIQISYAIGIAEPISISIDTFGTHFIPCEKIDALVAHHFDLRPKGIIEMLNLLQPIYKKTAVYGHFGREEPEFTWEKIDKALTLREDAGLR